MNKNEEIKKIIDPHRTFLHPRKMKLMLRGATVGTSSKFLIEAYGCKKCVLQEHCEYFPHTNGICGRRSAMYVEYLKAQKGEIVPLMIDQLAKLSVERDLEHHKCIESGSLSEEYFKLNYLCMNMQEKIHRATEGTKLKIEHTWIDELRNARKIVEVEGDNSSEPGPTEELQSEVPEDSEDPGQDFSGT